MMNTPAQTSIRRVGLIGAGADDRKATVPDQVGQGAGSRNQNFINVQACLHARCLTCKCFNELDVFTSNVTDKIFNTISHINSLSCNTWNIIYCIQCVECNIQYVGESKQKLSTRIGQHRRSINNKINKGCKRVVEHFNNNSCKNFKVTILEKIADSGDEDIDKLKRLERERYWICKLRTKYPYGLNEKLTKYNDALPILANLVTNNHTIKSKDRRKRKKYRNKQNTADSRSKDFEYQQKQFN